MAEEDYVVVISEAEKVVATVADEEVGVHHHHWDLVSRFGVVVYLSLHCLSQFQYFVQILGDWMCGC